MVTEGNLTLGGEHSRQHTYGVLLNRTLETYIVLLTNITPNKFNLKKKKNTGIFIETHTGIFSHGLHAPSTPTTLSSSTQDTEGSDKVEAGEALTAAAQASAQG